MHGIELRTKRLVLRTPRPGDGAAYARYYTENREFLQPWSPTLRQAMFCARDWEDSIPVIQQQLLQGITVRFGLFLDRELVGVANFTDIKQSPFYAAILGYTLSERAQGQGLMHEALSAAIQHMFKEKRLHRIHANYMPRNERSGRLLRRLGFQVEGYARDYLLIDGRWEDHVMTGIVNPNWHGSG